MPANSQRKRKFTASPGDRIPDAATIRQMVLDKTAERINAKLDESMSKTADKVARQTAKHIDTLDRLAAHLDMLDVWTRSEPGARRPRFTREEIAATAIRIADVEGFDAVSMRRIAAELEAGTMTLYHYVRTKDELLALVTDTLMAEVVVPEGELPDDWRSAITAIARRSRDMVLKHPWILDIADDPNLGPNSVRHFDQSLQAVSGLDAGLEERLDVMTVVDEYVFGYCLHQRTNFHDDKHNPVSDEMIEYVTELTGSGDYPQLSKLIDEYGSKQSWAKINAHAFDGERFDRNLARILDGLEADISRGKNAGPRA